MQRSCLKDFARTFVWLSGSGAGERGGEGGPRGDDHGLPGCKYRTEQDTSGGHVLANLLMWMDYLWL